MFETLENRQMFAVTAAAFHETLYVYGDAGNNGISVTKEGNDLVAKQYAGGSYNEFFRASDAYVKSVRVYGYAGLDTVTINDNVTDPAHVYGGPGADYIKGGGGQSELWGHGNWPDDPSNAHNPSTDDSSADTLISGKGYAIQYGQKGNDTLLTDDNAAGSNHDVMYGGPGNDKFYINGHGNHAYAFGEAGADTFVAKQAATQKASFYGGTDWDAVDYTAWTSGVYVKPDGLVYSGARFTERRQIIQSDVEFVQGTEHNDHFSGSEGNNTFYGHGGNDWLYGHGGNDLLAGGAGDDLVDGGAGNDILIGDAGRDRLNGGAGDDSAYGGTGNDEIRGGLGNDKLYGDADSDHIYGDGGSDKLVGGTGADYLVSHDGSTGNDAVFGDNENGTGSAGALDVAYIDESFFFDDFVVGVESY